MGSTEQAFEKIRQGKLPLIYKEEKDTKILKNTLDDTNYFIIGKGITANELVIELKKWGIVFHYLGLITDLSQWICLEMSILFLWFYR